MKRIVPALPVLFDCFKKLKTAKAAGRGEDIAEGFLGDRRPLSRPDMEMFFEVMAMEDEHFSE
jgi:hypothetical protein